jgi:hypothetical protein
MTINSTNNTKNAVEIRAELNAKGISIEYIYVNDQKLGILGTTGTKDRENALKAIQTALDASDGDIYEMMAKLSTIATIEEHEIQPDEMIEVCGEQIIISYSAKTAYTIDGVAIATCIDITAEMPNEAIKAVLVARIEALVAAENDNGYYGDEYI